MDGVWIWDTGLDAVRQTDRFTCGPTIAMVAGALLDPGYAATLDATPAGCVPEQQRIHRAANLLWPRWLGMTPGGLAAAISRHSAPLGVRYGWRLITGAEDRLADAVAAVGGGWPVALLVGDRIPRHWLLLTGHPDPTTVAVYDPGPGRVHGVAVGCLPRGAAEPGFHRAFGLVLPTTAG